MKRIFSLILALAMTLSLAACGSKQETVETVPAVSVEGTLEELLNKVVEEQPVEFMGGVVPIDLEDTTEDGLWALKSYTGLDSAEGITEAAVYEPLMGSIAFSMAMVRVPGGNTKTIAEAMKSGIDTRKWICVEADDLLVAGFADVVMLIMLDTASGMTAQSFVDAFQKVVGGELEFTI